ncbi:hypothetical protein [Janthinobacterium sp. RB2P8]|uniref:hypothetical protein n=1 Tax=Janthinobacterium sp. RB2P8 TaxID=3424191 RepID=UPI003F28B1AA
MNTAAIPAKVAIVTGASRGIGAAIVADAGDVQALFDAADAAHGGVDVLINNAGIIYRRSRGIPDWAG